MSNNISYSTHSYNIQNLTQIKLSTLNSTFSNQINYLLNFYKSHKIKHLNLPTSYQITLTLLNSSNLDLLKLISLLFLRAVSEREFDATTLFAALQEKMNLPSVLNNSIPESVKLSCFFTGTA